MVFLVCHFRVNSSSTCGGDRRGLAYPAARRFYSVWRLALGLALVGLSSGLALVAGLYWSDSLLMVEHAPGEGEVIVILGGEPRFRPPRALALYQSKLASTIFVSGDGDGKTVRRWLVKHGVPGEAIQMESSSTSTRENADFTVPKLRERGVQRVILVTSWFHSRRALACFQQAAPEMEFISLPTTEDRPQHGWPSRYERQMILREYAKLFGYWVRYGVSPFAVR